MTRTRAWTRAFVPVFALALLLGTAPVANAESPDRNSSSIAAKTLDLIVVRPLTLVQTMLGGFVVVVSFPLFIFNGDPEDVLDVAIRNPMEYFLNRPLGEF